MGISCREFQFCLKQLEGIYRCCQIGKSDRSFLQDHNNIFKMDATIFREPFQRFDFDGDLEVSTEEFGNFEEHFALDSSHYDEFLANYWHIFDTDNSGTLNFEEFMYVFAAMADGFARLLPKVRKFISFLK